MFKLDTTKTGYRFSEVRQYILCQQLLADFGSGSSPHQISEDDYEGLLRSAGARGIGIKIMS